MHRTSMRGGRLPPCAHRPLKRGALILAMITLGACSSVSLPPMQGAAPPAPSQVGEAPAQTFAKPAPGAAQSAGVDGRSVEASALEGGDARDRAEVDRLIRSLEARGADATEIRQAERGSHIAPDSIWTRIRAGFGLPALNTPLVKTKTRQYLARPDYLDRMMTRASRYLYHIVEEIERRGMPMEIALLPFVESAMNPTALSHAEAAGLWQFIPSTGRAYDLKQNWWVDNRRDVVESTRAALDYLQMLNQMHGGDWFLALASYNWGEGSVKRAIRRNEVRGQPTDYLSLRMPRETRHYVPKLLALKEILLQAEELGLKLPEVPNRPYFVVIEKTRPIDLDLAAEFAGMPVEDFVSLNPAHNRPVISASRNNRIKIPAENLDHFLDAMAAHEKAGRPFVTWRPYTLRDGETVAKVAARAGMDAGTLLKINGLSESRRIIAGTRLLVPDEGGAEPEHIAAFHAPTVVEIVDRPERFYQVRGGDSLGRIASRFGVASDDLRRWNGMRNNHVFVGQRLLVAQPTRETVRTTQTGARQVIDARATKTLVYRPDRHHAVARGDTLSGIAARYEVSMDDLRRWNGLRGSVIRVGQRLQVARATTQALAAERAAGPAVVRVARGDTLTGIARRHSVSINDLQRWNRLKGDTIFLGQRLRVAMTEQIAMVAAEPVRPASARSSPAPAQKEAAAVTPAVVKVRRGDTLTGLARRHNVSIADLRRWNSLRRDTLFVGASLRVSAPEDGSKLVRHHKVRDGDTLTEIARRYGVSIADLRRMNKLRDDTIRSGQRLLIVDESAA